MATRRWNAVPNPEWVLMYRKGLSRQKIAELSGASDRTVRSHIKTAMQMDSALAGEHASAGGPRPSGVRIRARSIERMNDLIAMVQATSRYPSARATNAEERSLAAWLRRRRIEAQSGTLANEFRKGLGVLPDWQGTPRFAVDEARWQERLNALIAYLAAGHDWPRHKATDTDEEHNLGVWLHTQRYKLTRDDLSPAKKQALDSSVPGWAAGRKHGRKPRR